MVEGVINRIREELGGGRKSLALGLIPVIAVVGAALALGGGDPQNGPEVGDGGQVAAGQAGVGETRAAVTDGSGSKPNIPAEESTKDSHGRSGGSAGGTAELRPAAEDGSGGKGAAPDEGSTANVKSDPGKPGIASGGTAGLDAPEGRPVGGSSDDRVDRDERERKRRSRGPGPGEKDRERDGSKSPGPGPGEKDRAD